jgi:NDP-sugar pyrophosphorylase family protein
LQKGGGIKAVILAGGFGTRLSEETALRPKPMVEIGEKPILWHIMNIYAALRGDGAAAKAHGGNR